MTWPNDVTKKDIRIEFYRGSGKGGQHRNKTDSACRMTHIPTGITAQAEDQRKQNQNKKICFKRLAAKLVPLMKAAAVTNNFEPNKERVRTYHEPRQTVKDHRTGKIYNYESILNGDLDQIINDI